MKLFDYDDTDINSIYSYAKKLEGMTFYEVLGEYERSPIKSYGGKLYDAYANFENMVVREKNSRIWSWDIFERQSERSIGQFHRKILFWL